MLNKRLLPPTVDEPPESGTVLDDPDDGLVAALEELDDPQFALALELLEPELGLVVEELDEPPELGLEPEAGAFPAELDSPEGLDPALLEPPDFFLSSSFVILVLPPALIPLLVPTPSVSRLLSNCMLHASLPKQYQQQYFSKEPNTSIL